jgi:hypothetical protein
MKNEPYTYGGVSYAKIPARQLGPRGNYCGHTADSVSRAVYGYEPTREEAMAAFAKSWWRE